ncbi:MAG TPA: hypothetical protein VGE23_01520 [Candidatus Paceibacterota bacterium]
MSTLLKLAAVVLVIAGLWVWVSGRSVTEEVAATVPPVSLSAAAVLAPTADEGPFDQEGTILIDDTQGQGGTYYLLYTEYDAQGAPAVKTKRLVFPGAAACAEANLPCVTNQPAPELALDERVRVVGTAKNEQVQVSALYRLGA